MSISQGTSLLSGDPEPGGIQTQHSKQSERFLAASGYILICASMSSFGALIVMSFMAARTPTHMRYDKWIAYVSDQAAQLLLLAVGILTAVLGRRLLTFTQQSYARTIPKYDMHLIQEAVVSGKSEPIDQYVRLRSLTGWAGTFTKLGITGLPLTTVFLTLVFSAIALFQVGNSGNSKDFLDLAKLTLGAFIGSFVQRNVEQRRQESSGGPTRLVPPES